MKEKIRSYWKTCQYHSPMIFIIGIQLILLGSYPEENPSLTLIVPLTIIAAIYQVGLSEAIRRTK